MESSNLQVAILSSPGMGHVVPVLELGKHLVTNHGLQVTILVVTTHTSPTEAQLFQKATAISQNLRIIVLPPVDISGLVTPNTKVVTQLAMTMRESLPAIRSALSAMNHRPTMFISDLFGTKALKIADEFHMPNYVYVTSTAWFTALSAYSHVLDKQIEGQYVDQTEPLRIPGCKPVRPEDVVDPMLDRNEQQYKEHVRMGAEFSMSDGILVNTWEDLERTSLKAFRDDEILRSVIRAPVYPIGPLTKPIEVDSSDNELLQWLEQQPRDSVMYVSFGSGGTMSAEQIIELAWGLEQSQHMFVWVVRPPIEGHADASFFKSGNDQKTNLESEFLPDGFLARTHNVGMVLPLWAPQMKILSHPSVGGFMSHCGWNSTLESLTNGVPMVAWPLYAEQRLNATMLTEDLGVAVRPKVLPTKKVVRRREIEEMVRTVMEGGKVMRERVKELKESAEKALSHGGSSYNSLCQVIRDCQLILESRQIHGPH